MRRILLIGVLLGIAGSLQAAEEGNVSVKAEVDRAFLTIGERVEYRVTITHDPTVPILSQIPPPRADVFEVKEAHDFSEKEGNEVVEGRRFVLTTYELGEFILDPITVRYRTLQGEEKTVQTHRLFLTVQSVDASGKPKTDIRNVKGVLELPWRWGWLGSLFLFALAIGAGVTLWWRWKHRALAGEITPEPVLSPEDEALLGLNRLFDSDLIRQGKIKEYFLALSEILRRYFERRFEILAVESTTSEILQALRQEEISQSLREKIEQTLSSADLVKFAKWRPPLPEIIKVNQLAKAIVEEARPLPPPAQEGGDPVSHGV